LLESLQFCIWNAKLHGMDIESGYIERSAGAAIEGAFREFPVVVVVGPRQSGKTTLLRRMYPQLRYVSLDAPDSRAVALADPRGFLERLPAPAILDEIQRAPELLTYIKERVDSNRHLTGQFLLTGSQNLLLMQQVSESLAGRAAVLRLLPLSYREMAGRPAAKLPWAEGEARAEIDHRSVSELDSANHLPILKHDELWKRILRGSYPEIALAPNRNASLWHGSYIQTYLERDVRMLRQIGDLGRFQDFLRALAARNAQLLNLSELSRDLGIAVNTAKIWLSVLEASFQVLIVRPWFANVGKRLVKTPKLYFMDTGTLCYLAGLKDPDHAARGPLGGALFETAVLGEIVRSIWHRGEEPRVHFWRTSTGQEVDFLVEHGNQIVPVEVKLSATPKPQMAKSIADLRKLLDGSRFHLRPGFVIHPGEADWPLGPDAQALPFGKLWD